MYPGLLTRDEVGAMCVAATRQGVHGDDLCDVLQEAAVTLWQRGLSGVGIAYRVARNRAVEAQRAAFGRHARREFCEAVELPGPDDAAAGAVVREALDSLPEQDRDHAEALMQADDGATLARDLGVSRSLIQYRTNRLRDALARCL